MIGTAHASGGRAANPARVIVATTGRSNSRQGDEQAIHEMADGFAAEGRAFFAEPFTPISRLTQ